MKKVFVVVGIFAFTHVAVFYIFWMFGATFSERGVTFGMYTLYSLLFGYIGSMIYINFYADKKNGR